jgi:hypothetical protein
VAQVLRPEWVEEYGPLQMDELIAMQDRGPYPAEYDPPKARKKLDEVKPAPPLAEPARDPKWEPCPAGYVEFGPYYVKPKVTWVQQTHPFGCYALGINHVQLVVSRPSHKNGIGLTANDYVMGEDYRPKYATRDDVRFFNDTYGISYPHEDMSLIMMTRQPKHLELFKSLFKIGGDDAWPLFIAQLGACGMCCSGTWLPRRSVRTPRAGWRGIWRREGRAFCPQLTGFSTPTIRVLPGCARCGRGLLRPMPCSRRQQGITSIR